MYKLFILKLLHCVNSMIYEAFWWLQGWKLKSLQCVKVNWNNYLFVSRDLHPFVNLLTAPIFDCRFRGVWGGPSTWHRKLFLCIGPQIKSDFYLAFKKKYLAMALNSTSFLEKILVLKDIHLSSIRESLI